MSAGKLEVTTTKPGKAGGRVAKPGRMVTVHYVGWMVGEKTPFDSSRERGEGFSFELGSGQVIEGWDQGLVDMVVGEVRQLTVPPALAYGETGFDPVIPPGATLVFDVELIAVV